MVLSSSERDDLVLRVERLLARTPGPVRVRRALVRAAVDRTLGALHERARSLPSGATAASAAHPAANAGRATAIFAAASAPDLATRTRRALEAAGVRPMALASAREGRHTVVTVEVNTSDEEAVRAAARALGASCAWRGGIA
jgi:hypothetical protein